MQTAPETQPLPRGRPPLLASVAPVERDPSLARARTVALPAQRSITGVSENTIRRLHADEVAAGRAGFLIKCGRSTLLDVEAWSRWVERQPPAHMLSDRKQVAA